MKSFVGCVPFLLTYDIFVDKEEVRQCDSSGETGKADPEQGEADERGATAPPRPGRLQQRGEVGVGHRDGLPLENGLKYMFIEQKMFCKRSRLFGSLL